MSPKLATGVECCFSIGTMTLAAVTGRAETTLNIIGIVRTEVRDVIGATVITAPCSRFTGAETVTRL
jgi:hypothetical protein